MRATLALITVVPGLLLCIGSSSAQFTSTPIQRPLAMDRLRNPATDLFVLTATEVAIFHDDGQRLSAAGKFALPSSMSPSDLVVAQVGGQVSLLVAGANRVSGGIVYRYDAQGRLLNSWRASHAACGADYDGAGTMFFASCDTNEIYRIDLRSGQQSYFVGEVNGAHHLGPVLVDGQRGRLLVGEIDSGEIYAMDLKTHHCKLFTRGFGTPQAFAFSPNFREILVADSSRRKIYRVDLAGNSPKPVDVGAPDILREPDGVALLGDGRIAVADVRGNAVLTLPAHW